MGNTPLHYCMLHKVINKTILAMAELLLKAGADPNQKNRMGESPLYLCVPNLDIDSIVLLLKYGTNPHLRDYVTGINCFTNAHIRGFSEVVQMFVDADKERALKDRATQKVAAGVNFSQCTMCGKKGTLCAGCYLLHYCSDTCQSKD